MENEFNTKRRGIFSSYLSVIFLPFFMYILAVLAYVGVIKLNMPLHTLIMCGILLIFAIFFATQNEYCAYAKIKKNSHIFENDLKEFIKSNSFSIDNVTKANVDFDEFLQEYLHRLKPLSFGNIASAVFPMLGILGTFISIAVSMPNFANSFVMEDEISKLLGGIATAFYVSIYGVFLTIWWMFFARLGVAKINSFKENFKHASKKYFWSKEELERLSLKKNYELLENNSTLLKSLYDNEFFTKLSALHQEKFNSFLKLFSSYEKIALVHTELAQKTLDLSSKNNEEIELHLSEFNKKLQNSVGEFKKIKEELLNEIKDFKEYSIEKNMNSLEENVKNLKQEASKILNEINNAK